MALLGLILNGKLNWTRKAAFRYQAQANLYPNNSIKSDGKKSPRLMLIVRQKEGGIMKQIVSPLYKDEMGIQRVILNPNVPIPMQVCNICWNILDDETAYCRRCGHVGTVFSTPHTIHQKCFTHKKQDAAHFCNYCSMDATLSSWRVFIRASVLMASEFSAFRSPQE